MKTSGNNVVDLIDVGQGAEFIAINQDRSLLYVTNFLEDTVSVIETFGNSVIATIPVGDGPQGIAITPNDQFIYVVNAIDTFVSVIRTSDNTVVDEIEVGVGSIALGTFIVPPPPLPRTPVPTLSQWGLLMMVGILGTIGFIAIRRKRALA